MAFELFKDPVQGACFIILIVFTLLSILCVGLKFLASRRVAGRTGVEDWFALGALLCYVGWVVSISIALHFYNGKSDEESVPIENIMAGLKIFWVSGFFFGPNQLCAKMSILFLYHRIFGKNAAYARWTLFLGLVQIACTIVEVLVNTFQCAPVRKFWDLKEKDGHCIDTGVYLVTMESVNSTVDFAMAILAMYMLRDLQMSLRAKIRVGLVFVAAAWAGIVGFVTIHYAFFRGSLGSTFMWGIWATLQMSFSIICCSVITLKPLFTGRGLFSRFSKEWSTDAENTSAGQRIHSRTKTIGMRSGAWINLGTTQKATRAPALVSSPSRTYAVYITGGEREAEHADAGHELRILRAGHQSP